MKKQKINYKYYLIAIFLILITYLSFSIQRISNLGVYIILLGALLNFLVMYLNKKRMPVYVKKSKNYKDTNVHRFTYIKGKIKLFYLADIFSLKINKKYAIVYSIGDLFIVLGLLIYFIFF